jgi:hypothetical protein
VKKPKLLLAAVVLLIGAVAAAGTRLTAAPAHGERVMLMLNKGGS